MHGADFGISWEKKEVDARLGIFISEECKLFAKSKLFHVSRSLTPSNSPLGEIVAFQEFYILVIKDQLHPLWNLDTRAKSPWSDFHVWFLPGFG